jgi:hypothetical protein
LRPPFRQLRIGHLEHEVGREAIDVPADLFLEAAGVDIVKGRQVTVHHHLLPADDIDLTFYHLIRYAHQALAHVPKVEMDIAECDIQSGIT